MTQQEYKQKRRECWEEFKRENLDGEVQWQPVSRYDVFCAAFDRAYALGKQEKKESERLQAKSAETLRIASEESHYLNLSQETANCDKHFDNISKDCRLNIAAMAMQGILCNPRLLKIAIETYQAEIGSPNIYVAVANAAKAQADALIAKIPLSCKDLTNKIC